MKKIDGVLYVVLTAIIVIGIYSIYGLTQSNSPANLNTLGMISTGSTDSGDVEIGLIPVKIDNRNLILNIALNTHSVDLSQFDLKQITVLRYNGKTAYPIEAPKIVGHHSSGSIVFNVNGDLKDFTITIKGIPKVEERVYEWKG